MKPLISVILPVYNAEEFLIESIESILKQTFEDFELLIIDDGSTDNSRNIILSNIDKRIVYFENRTNLGIVYSLNKGLYYSRGRYIARMDADDVSSSNRFEEQIKYLFNQRSIAVLGTLVNSGNSNSDLKNFTNENNEFLKIHLLKSNVLIHPTVMIDNHILKNSKLYYDRSALYAEDYKLWTDMSINNLKIGRIEKDLYYYRLHKNQISQLKNELQKQRSLEIKISYAKYYFGNLISQNLKTYLGLITETKFSDIDFSRYNQLGYQLINHNKKYKFFSKSLFNEFIHNLLEAIKKKCTC